jgi:hypothetical protein
MHAKAVAATAIFPGLICSFSLLPALHKALCLGCTENVASEVRFQALPKLVQKYQRWL